MSVRDRLRGGSSAAAPVLVNTALASRPLPTTTTTTNRTRGCGSRVKKLQFLYFIDVYNLRALCPGPTLGQGG